MFGACGSDGGGASSEPDSAAARDAARLKLNECLRRNGVDVQEGPAPGGGGGAAVRIGGRRDEIEKAMNGPCKKLQQAAFADISPEDRQEFEDAFQKFAQCMREHGVDLPEPTTSSAGGGPVRSGVRIDGDDPDFQEAQKACGDKLPEGGFRARAGGGGQ